MYKEPSFTQSDNYLGEKNHSIHIHLNSLFLIFVTETISRNNNCLKTFLFKSKYLQIIFKL